MTYYFHRDSLDDIWNSPTIRSIRQRMLQGEKIEACKRCWDEEKVKKTSKRIRTNQKFLAANKDRLKEATMNQGRLSKYPSSLDLRFGNFCNLKCRMCTPSLSSLWEKEIKNHIKDFQKSSVLRATYGKSRVLKGGKITKWFLHPVFLETIKKIDSDLEEIYLSGGEPLLIKEQLSFMDYFVTTKHCQNITISLNSNITKILSNPSFLERLTCFKTVYFGASIDAYGEKNNWLRSPSKFPWINKNMIQLLKVSRQHRNIHPYINCAVSVYNVLYIKDLIAWSRQLFRQFHVPMDIHFDIVGWPAFQHVSVLTKKLKQRLIKDLEFIQKRYRLTEREQNGIDSLFFILQSSMEDNEAILDMRKQLKEHTLLLDKWRREDFFSVFPDFVGEL